MLFQHTTSPEALYFWKAEKLPYGAILSNSSHDLLKILDFCYKYLSLIFIFIFENGNGVFFIIKEMLVTCKQRGAKEEKKKYL